MCNPAARRHNQQQCALPPRPKTRMWTIGLPQNPRNSLLLNSPHLNEIKQGQRTEILTMLFHINLCKPTALPYRCMPLMQSYQQAIIPTQQTSKPALIQPVHAHFRPTRATPSPLTQPGLIMRRKLALITRPPRKFWRGSTRKRPWYARQQLDLI